MSNQVESQLTRLPEPEPPVALAPNVMARVSRLAETRAPAFALPAPVRTSGEEHVRGWKDLPAWGAALAGLAIVFFSWIRGGLERGSWLEVVSSQVGAPNAPSTASNAPAVLWLALGLLVYVAGLFAPLENRRRQHRG